MPLNVPLAGMAVPKWVGIAITIAWAVQLHTLWPLPNEIAAEMAATAVPSVETLPKGVLESLEWSMWLNWLLWLVVVPVGIASGILAASNRRYWNYLFLTASLVYLLVLCPWRLSWTIHARSFESLERFTQHWSWVVLRPSLIWGSIIFPIVVILGTTYVLARMAMARRAERIGV